jgi:hypothetical protein
MVAQVLRGPHNLYRRYQAGLESALTAVGLALLAAVTLHNFQVYPYEWVVVLGIAIGLAGVRWPVVAYLLAVGVMVYPIYTINLYLAVLFLAASALLHRSCIYYLGATVLILATPLLAKYYLHWLVPILAGLWWGGMRGAWVGALASIWGKVLGGMAGLNIDWLILAGHPPEVAAITARFAAANSLQTLLLLVEPFATTSSVILYNLLQVGGWAVAGGFVGTFAYYRWVKYRAPWSTLVLTAGGGLIMLATHLGMPYWLHEAITPETVAVLQDPTGPLFSMLMIVIVGTTVYSLRESLDLPVAPPQPVRTARRNVEPSKLFRRPSKPEPQKNQSETDDLNQPRRPVRIPHYSELPEWEPPATEAGLIMLEID